MTSSIAKFAGLAAFAMAPILACAPAGPQGRVAPVTRWTPAPVATEGYESSPTFTPGGEEMYFVSADPGFRNYRILKSTCRDGVWTSPEPAPFAATPPAQDADPFVTADGLRLYFISTRQASRQGDFDIWYVERTAAGDWGEPRRLPEPVNSTGSELLPRMTAGGVLYFGSDRAGGFGQSDIYVASPDGDGSWTVQNVGPPVSTAANDYEAEVSSDGRMLVLVSDRGDRSHLYAFTRRADGWTETGRLPGRDDVFQVGPTLSPKADRLLFAQADGQWSGELYLTDLRPGADPDWPPCSRAKATRR